MKASIYTIAALICMSVISMAADSANNIKTALTSIGAVSDLDAPPDPDDPGIGGGFRHSAYFRNRFIPKLADCTQKVEKVFIAWSQSKSLSLPRRESTPGNILFHATAKNLDGIFELTYRVAVDRYRARTSVFYFKKDGTKLEPSLIQELLESWDIAALQDTLDNAIKCENA